MLATPGELPSGEGWWSEIKWDGIRAIVRIDGDGGWGVWTRNGIDRTVAWPELAGLVEQFGSTSAVLDGELVVLDGDGRPDFGLIQHRMHTSRAADAERLAEELPVTLLAFDLLELGEQSLVDLPLRERRRLLEALELDGPAWRTSPVYPDGADLLAVAEERGLEGIVVKRADSRYRPGRRSPDWRKVKVDRRDTFVIGGWFAGTGRREETMGALALGQPVDDARPHELRFVGRVGTGFRDADLADLR
ncbi:MAG: DNA ligase, partial [Actinomycetota bacterium]